MCIIVAKPSGANIPDEETFNNCFSSNKDGIGFSYSLPGDNVTIVKGFANVKKLLKMLSAYHITKEHNLVVHFRFATHGIKDQGNCHPFPLTDKFDRMRWLSCSCDTAIAHNGVFSSVPSSEKYSDTMKFIGGVLAQPGVMENLETKAVKELIKGYCGFHSKLAFHRPSGLNLVGDFEQEDGVYYSNRQFKKYIYAPNNTWDKNSLGQDWCYLHKKYDWCEWCPDHKAMDTCEYDANNIKKWKDRFKEDKNTILISDCCSKKSNDLKCDICYGYNDVKWNNDEQGFMCAACVIEWGLDGRSYD